MNTKMLFAPSRDPTSVLIAVLLVLTGCTTASNRHSCHMPNGVRCLSTREVYAQSHNGNIPKEVGQQKAHKKTHITSKPVDGTPATGWHQLISKPATSMPLRSASQVIRIWIAPWQDKQDSLVMPGYLYTEIEPRKWLYGLAEGEAPAMFKPLRKTIAQPQH